MFHVDDRVELTEEIPGYGLHAGERGIIVAVRRDNRTLAVKMTRDGKEIGVYELHYVALRHAAAQPNGA